MKLHRVAILSSVLLCFSTAPAFARTLVVDNDAAECPQAEYNTIQQAVAVAEAGDKILVCPGLYRARCRSLHRTAHRSPGSAGRGRAAGGGRRGRARICSAEYDGRRPAGIHRSGLRPRANQNPGRKRQHGPQERHQECRIQRWYPGDQLLSSANLVEENTSYGNREDGIFVGPITGIPFEPASDNIIRHNETLNNRDGIHLNRTGPGNVVFGNRSHDNTQRGIFKREPQPWK